jgi:hypothetical protein
VSEHSPEKDAHLLPEWGEVVACTVRAALALRALNVALADYAAARVIPPGEGGPTRATCDARARRPVGGAG